MESDQLVVFKLGNEFYGISINKVKEIIKMEKAVKLPNMPYYLEGIINIRGKVYLIINLHTRFGMESNKIDENTKIIVASGRNVGFIVDEVKEIIRIDKENIDSLTGMALNLNMQFVQNIVKFNKDIIIQLNLENIMNIELEQQLEIN